MQVNDSMFISQEEGEQILEEQAQHNFQMSAAAFMDLWRTDPVATEERFGHCKCIDFLMLAPLAGRKPPHFQAPTLADLSILRKGGSTNVIQRRHHLDARQTQAHRRPVCVGQRLYQTRNSPTGVLRGRRCPDEGGQDLCAPAVADPAHIEKGVD